MDDVSVAPSRSITWIFTLGTPEDDLIDRLTAFMEIGGMSWVIVPIYNDTIDSLKPQLRDETLASQPTASD